jgi:hypothetical protein
VVVPDGVISVSRRTAAPEENPPDGGLVLTLRFGEEAVRLDADNGRVINIVEPLSEELVDALKTVRVGEPVGDPAPWPLGEQVPKGDKIETPSARYWEPDPASGIAQFIVCPSGDVGNGDGSCAIGITNGRSTWSVYPGGQPGNDSVHDSDRMAFDRWIQSLESVPD